MLLINPSWPKPKNVKAYLTTRIGGVSQENYKSLNLSTLVGDSIASVTQNRRLLKQMANLPSEPVWLQQEHGNKILTITHEPPHSYLADGAYTSTPGRVCVVLTADCLPALIASPSGDEVAVVHAGWRGMVKNILENCIDCFATPAKRLLVWLGPAIGPNAFLVHNDVRLKFLQHQTKAADAFVATGSGSYLANIYTLARQRLQHKGVQHIYGGTNCTFSQRKYFFSYRRNQVTGRMASLIWLEQY